MINYGERLPDLTHEGGREKGGKVVSIRTSRTQETSESV